MDIPQLCALCFSKDRILYLVANNEIALFNSLSPENHEFIKTFQRSSSLKVCFECRGRLRSVQKFMGTVQRSLTTLMKYWSSAEPMPLVNSSKLSVSKIKMESLLPTMEVEVEQLNCIVKLEAPENEDTPLNSSSIRDTTENVYDDSENYNIHNAEKVISVPLLSCIREKDIEDDESMYFDASNSVKVEMDSDPEGNDLDSGQMRDAYGEIFAETILMQTEHSNSKGNENSKDLLVVAKKKRSPKNKMWLLMDIVWLSNEQARKSYMSELERDSMLGNRERCHQCQRSFKRKADLTFHVLTHHEVLGATLECDICEYKFTKPIHLHRHVREHYLLYKCKMCDFETRYLHQMKIHTNDHEVVGTNRRKKKIVSPEGYPHRCNKCKNCFGTKRQLQGHSKQHGCYPTSAICDVCLKLFKNRDKYMHSCTYKETECADCHQKFKTVYFKRLHNCPYRVKVDGEQLFCTDCDKQFRSKKSYHYHITRSRKHISPKERLCHECPHCDRKFNTRPHLQRHMTNMHLRRNAFKCSECQKSFAERSKLSRHESRCHGASYVPVRDKICHVCGKDFEMQCYLRNHMRTHTGERPFKCDICGDTFRQRTSLRSHNRVKHLKQKSRLKPKTSEKRKEVPNDTAAQFGHDIVAHFMTPSQNG